MLIKNIRVCGYSEPNSIHTIHINDQGHLEIVPSNHPFPLTLQSFDVKEEIAIMPGWLDSHVHGFGGADFSEATPDNLHLITRALGKSGLSYCMATLVSLELSQLKKTLTIIDQYVDKQNSSIHPGHCQIVGIHLEGPFINHDCRGAHDEKVLQKKIDIELFKDIINAAPHITQWKITLAPDIEGAPEFIRNAQNLVLNGREISVKVFIGHTNADPHHLDHAIKLGAVGFTHLGNANQEKAHRCAATTITEQEIKSNVVQWVMTHANSYPFYIELIVDGEHLSYSFVKLMKEKLNDRIIQVTDALGPSGLNDGEYLLGTIPVIKKGEKFVLKDHPEKLAGSGATFAKVIEKFAEWSTNENDLLHSIYLTSVLNPRRGSLDQSIVLPDQSNFVIVNEKGQMLLSVCAGKITHQSASLEQYRVQ